MQENALLSVIVPCYNEADNLPLFYQHILPVCRSLCEQGSISDYEILLVNDGSKDRTLPTMRALSEQDPHVFFLSFTRNFGKEAAMLAGLSHSRGDFVTIMDERMCSNAPQLAKRRAAAAFSFCQSLLLAHQPHLRCQDRFRCTRLPADDATYGGLHSVSA